MADNIQPGLTDPIYLDFFEVNFDWGPSESPVSGLENKRNINDDKLEQKFTWRHVSSQPAGLTLDIWRERKLRYFINSQIDEIT